MNASIILSSLGFGKDYRLSAIVSKEQDLTDLNQEVHALQLSEPVCSIDAYIEKWRSLINTSPLKIELGQIGYLFWDNGIDPILTNMANAIQHIIDQIIQEEGLTVEGVGNADQKKKTSERLTEHFKQIARGYILLPSIKALENAKAMVVKYPAFFSISSISDDNLTERVKLIQAVENAGLNPNDPIREVEKKLNVAQGMIEKFESLHTPDRQKTIENSINIVRAKIDNKGFNGLWPIKNLYAAGYNMAIRGQNPSIFELISNDNNDDEYDIFGFNGRPFMNKIPPERFYSLFSNILEGFAGAYFLAYLEQEMRKKDQIATISPGAKADIPSTVSTPKINWNGTNKQLYAMFRFLKAEGVIQNTNEELSEIMKAIFDTFNNTTASTIQRELGRDQEIPKAKRIDHKKMLTSEDTP